MSPGATFERVYRELKRMLAVGELPPGTPIEPAIIGRQIASSITPVRDALHRLTGERLVEAPNHNGFRVPQPTEASLRDLYRWHGQLLGLAARSFDQAWSDDIIKGLLPGDDPASVAATLFIALARATGSTEHLRALQQINDRLAPFRRLEHRVIGELDEERDALLLHMRTADRKRLATVIDRYHRRRLLAVSALLALAHGEAQSAR